MASSVPPSAAQDALDQALGAIPKAEGFQYGERAEDYRVRIPVFEGPLDLLLHLIRKEQINIYDIPIARICKTYLEQIELMAQPDVNLAGEFMVMAATLTHLKSLMLLPKEEGTEADDPRMPLVAQLLEYEKFKRAADSLDTIPWLYRDIYPRSPAAIQEAMPVESLLDAPLEPIDNYQLLLCLKIAINRTTRPPMEIATDPTSIREKVVALTEFLESEPVVDFRRLLPELPRARDVIVAFLAMLELARLKFVEILQHESYGPIQIRSTRPLKELNATMLDSY